MLKHCLIQARNIFTTKITKIMAVPTFNLTQDIKIPAIGYGTWQATDEELEKAIESALEAGYRHIDTAHVYANEKVIGKVLKRWIDAGKVSRKDIFLVTKLPPAGNRAEAVQKFIKRSLTDLQVDYIDLFLVHTPFGFQDVEGDLHPMGPNGQMLFDMSTDHVKLWKAMEEQVDAGLAKTIGVSNFNQNQLQRIIDSSRIKPTCLQIELHAYLQQKQLVDFCKKNNMVVVAYSPLGSPGIGKFLANFGKQVDLPDVLGNPTVKSIAKKHNKTEAQVLLRHAIQKGISVIPKSTNLERLKQNINIFDFELDQDDMTALNNLDHGVRILDFTVFPGVKNHPEYPFPELK